MTKIKEFLISSWLSNRIDLPEQFKAEVIEEKEKAVYIKYETRKIWIPKSQIKASGANIYQTDFNRWTN